MRKRPRRNWNGDINKDIIEARKLKKDMFFDRNIN